MRALKFRVWDNISKRMNTWEDIKDISLSEFIELKHYTVMQDSGLTDMDNKNIYEGDIYINKDDDTDYYQVFFYEAAFCGGKSIKKSIPIAWGTCEDEETKIIIDDWYEYDLKVVGNIFENPDLIK